MEIQFGTDGWRGLTDKDFTEKNVKLAVQSIADYLKFKKAKKVVVGYDVRRKADQFAKTAAEILAANGLSVYLVEKACPTPTTGWAILDKKADGAIMFTASHNPAEFLGLKYMTEEAMVAPESTTNAFMENLKGMTIEQVKSMDFAEAKSKELITLFDPKPSYLAKLGELVDIAKIKDSSLNILINPMHGAGSGYLSQILEGGNLKIETINEEIDPNFGGIAPEPIVEKNVADAINRVKGGNYNVCLASDGDADRMGLIDEKGNMLTSLEAFLLLSYYVLEIKKIKTPIVKTLSNTIMVDHLCKKYDLPVYETKVGFKYVGEKMQETGAIFGGEESGGSSISNFMFVRDAQLMNLFVLDLMIEMQKPLSQILEEIEDYAGGGYKFQRIDIHFPYDEYQETKRTKVPELLKNIPKEINGKKVVNTRTDDGIKLYFEDDSWMLIRFSGTEPSLRTYAEAKTMDEVEKLLAFAKDYFK